MNIKKKIIKNNNTKTETKKIETNEIKKLGFIIIGICAVFLIFYGITCLLLNKEKKSSGSRSIEIQYDEILLNKLLEQSEETYYVLVTLEDDEDLEQYNTNKENYEKLENHDKIYTSNLSNLFNKPFISEQTNTNITNITDLKLSKSILIKINNKKISNTYDGSDAIIEQFKKMID